MGLEVLDVSNPTAPARVGGYPTTGLPAGLAVADHCLFIADGEAGVVVLDVANPAAPVLAGSYDTPGWATDVAVSGNRVIVADGE
jgi:hypothetical protein